MSRRFDDVNDNAQTQADSETGSATAGAASGATGQVGAAVGSDRSDRNFTGTTVGQERADRSFVGSTTDTDVGDAEAQKRGVVVDSNNLTYQNEVLRQLSTQALQNAVETANMVSKQAVRHADLAIDRQWNVNETDAYATILADAIAKSINDR